MFRYEQVKRLMREPHNSVQVPPDTPQHRECHAIDLKLRDFFESAQMSILRLKDDPESKGPLTLSSAFFASIVCLHSAIRLVDVFAILVAEDYTSAQ